MTQEEKDAQLKELKAKAYDALAAKEHFERELMKFNQEIEKLSKTQIMPVENNADHLNV
jgi:hypothetical protein